MSDEDGNPTDRSTDGHGESTTENASTETATSPLGADRRAVLMAAAAAGVSGAGLLGTVVTARSPEGQPVSPSETTLPNPDLPVTRVDRSVKAAVPHWEMLTLPEDTVVKYIKQSDAGSARQREAIDALTELRRQFPIRREQNGNETRLVLATDRGPSRETSELARTAHRLFADGSGGGAARTQHAGSIHEAHVRESCEEMGIDGAAKDDLVEGADDPDNWDVKLQIPDGIPHESTVREGLETGFNYMLRYYAQYFDPGVFEIYHTDNHDIDFGELGGAPEAGSIEYDYADYYGSDLYLGRTTHYFSDMSVPLHTSMGWEQVNLEIYTASDGTIDWRIDPMYWLHDEHELYVKDNWSSGENLRYQYNSNNCSAAYCYYPINSVKTGLKDLADVSEDYAYDIYQKILDEGDVGWQNWSYDTESYVRDAFENTLHELGLYTRGVIELMH